MRESLELQTVMIAVGVLAYGALMRGLSRRAKLPFSAVMLVSGALAGLGIDRLSTGAPAAEALAHAVHPDLIIFVFLPALVFESSFALDAHAFWKERSALGLLAAPALVVSAVVVAVSMMFLTASSWAWTWPVALVFGALISATDPVAVVALLRDVGAPKRLGLLIEGESLLNDGTSIVAFGVLVVMLTTGNDLQAGTTMVEFVRVVLGGVIVGVLIAAVVTAWLSRTFNDPLVEIPLTIVAAYAAMIIAEHWLHVSGVIAVVTCGLWIGSRGRTALSPEVRESLTHFWHLIAHVANTLIFFLVGLLIVRQIEMASLGDLMIVLGAYLIIVVVRFAVTFAFQPLITALGGRVSSRESAVMAWSGLRGAVSLALALIVCQNDGIPREIQRDILLTTAGVVFLTIMINGNTVGALLKRLGFDKRPCSDSLARVRAEHAALVRVGERLTQLAHSRDLEPLDWREVRSDLSARILALSEQSQRYEEELNNSGPEGRTAGTWVQALRMERESYWEAFDEGTLGARALRLLDLDVDRQLDRIAGGDPSLLRSHLEALQRGALDRVRSLVGERAGLRFTRLSLVYDVTRGDVRACERVLAGFALLGVDEDDPDANAVVEHYTARLTRTTQRAEELRVTHPELVRAVERRLAHRVALNVEREEYRRLAQHGLVDESDGERLLDDVERRMKGLRRERPHKELPDALELLSSATLLEVLPDELRERLADEAKEHVIAPDEVVFEEGDTGESLYVIARGAVRVYTGTDEQRTLVDVLGAGAVFGEMAFLGHTRRTASVEAATSVTLLELPCASVKKAMAEDPRLEEGLFRGFAERAFDRVARTDPRFAHLSRDARRTWFARADVLDLEDGAAIPAADCAITFLVTGRIVGEAGTFKAPAVLSAEVLLGAKTEGKTRLALLSAPPAPAT